jgi:hypothetical protein
LDGVVIVSGRFVAVVLVIVIACSAMWYQSAAAWRVERGNRNASTRLAPAGYFEDEKPPSPFYAEAGE